MYSVKHETHCSRVKLRNSKAFVLYSSNLAYSLVGHPQHVWATQCIHTSAYALCDNWDLTDSR